MQHATQRTTQHGAALVEFALILPLLLTLTIFVAEFGRAIMYYNTLTKSVRDAARYLSTKTPGTRLAEAKNLIVYGTPTAGATALVPGLTTAMVPDPVWQTQGTLPVINVVTVRVQGYTFRPMWSGVFGKVLNPINFSTVSASMRTTL
ncbi:TadE family protein [Ramlibacter sp.]|uniref:TadE/TadG family type IV pilus assembly protein n=1 Tax=Ramlibacter sp. TaxID=1917967 RepID=UPI00183C89C9|nr:TadE family protein [Ramlibacter sp.]MBA2676222.1 pilus assembly protein [Ramlibacter sp.]